jgi:hypothetical protein
MPPDGYSCSMALLGYVTKIDQGFNDFSPLSDGIVGSPTQA